jgi:hypothetical protein
MEHPKKKEAQPSDSKNMFEHSQELYIFRDYSAEDFSSESEQTEFKRIDVIDFSSDDLAASLEKLNQDFTDNGNIEHEIKGNAIEI